MNDLQDQLEAKWSSEWEDHVATLGDPYGDSEDETEDIEE